MSSPRPFAFLATGAFFALAGCLDLTLVGDIAFPPTVPGLAVDQPWVTFPVGSWVQEGSVQASAIAACFAPACGPQAAVALFRATGAEAVRLREIARDPGQLVRALAATRPTKVGREMRAVTSAVSSEPLRDGAAQGFALRIARADGSHAAFGAVLASERPGTLTVVVVVSPSPEGAKRIAREVAAAQAG